LIDLNVCELGGKHTDIIHARDENGWQAIHEAARGGFLEVVKYLVVLGADITATTDAMQV
jgi:ankyrin repeat protein